MPRKHARCSLPPSPLAPPNENIRTAISEAVRVYHSPQWRVEGFCSLRAYAKRLPCVRRVRAQDLLDDVQAMARSPAVATDIEVRPFLHSRAVIKSDAGSQHRPTRSSDSAHCPLRTPSSDTTRNTPRGHTRRRRAPVGSVRRRVVGRR